MVTKVMLAFCGYPTYLQLQINCLITWYYLLDFSEMSMQKLFVMFIGNPSQLTNASSQILWPNLNGQTLTLVIIVLTSVWIWGWRKQRHRFAEISKIIAMQCNYMLWTLLFDKVYIGDFGVAGCSDRHRNWGWCSGSEKICIFTRTGMFHWAHLTQLNRLLRPPPHHWFGDLHAWQMICKMWDVNKFAFTCPSWRKCISVKLRGGPSGMLLAAE